MTSSQTDLDELKRRAALTSLDYLRHGDVVGLGTGSTAHHVILGLGQRVKNGPSIIGVPTSHDTADLARAHGIPLLESEGPWTIDVTIDGADQVDHTKRVPVLGSPFPLPVEVVAFGWASTARQIEKLGLKPVIRERDGHYYKTDAGHHILDLHIDRIGDPAALETALNLIPGVVETGLFVGRTSVLIVGTPNGIETHEAEHYRGRP